MTWKENKEVVDSFISEGLDLIDDAEVKMTQMEENPEEEVVNTIFRMFHSIKGSADFLNFSNIKKVTHEAETLLDLFRKKRVKPGEKEMDILYQTIDFLRQVIENVGEKLSDESFESQSEIIVHNISDSIEAIRRSLEEGSEKKANSEEKFVLDEIPISADMIEKYRSESLENLEKAEQLLIEMEEDPKNEDKLSEIFRMIHSFKGNSGFFGLKDLEEISMEMENVLDKIRESRREMDGNLVTLLLKGLDLLIEGLDSILENPLRVKISGEQKELFLSALKDFFKQEFESGVFKPVGKILVEKGVVSEKDVEEAVKIQKKKVGEILIDEGKVKASDVREAVEEQKHLRAPFLNDEVSLKRLKRREIRVDTEKLDKLFNLIGELIIAESMVTQHPEIKEYRFSEFDKATNNLTKITRELQELTTTIRMVPLEGLFNKMIRLVRDLSRKSGKEISFKIFGSETEMDRSIIEEISDPLVHLLRNAVDHGIESDRKKAGKASVGRITLGARYEGNEIWIMVSDDGKGLDTEKIFKKAKEKGLVKGKFSDFSEKQILQFIFQPGFSMAKKITEISGRGVGMDVVKQNIEKIRGRVDVESVLGEGTVFYLKIPLTLAIMDGMSVKIGSGKYSIPLSDVIQSLKVKQEQIHQTEEGNEIIRVRDEIFPVIRLNRFFKMQGSEDLREGILMIVEGHEQKAAFFVDKILGNQQIVVKSIPDYLGKIEGVMGCSVLGNGEISLIIDTGSIIKKVLGDGVLSD